MNKASTNSTASAKSNRVTGKQPGLLSKSEHDEQMRQEAAKLQAAGQMPPLEEVLGVFQQVAEKHAKRGAITLHPPAKVR